MAIMYYKKLTNKIVFFVIILFSLNLNYSIANVDESMSLDSLEKLLKSSKQDSNRVKVLIDLSEYFVNKDPNKALDFGNKAADLAEKINWEYGKNLAFIKIGKSYNIIGKFEKSLDVNLNALKYFTKIKNNNYIAISSNQVGENYSKLQKDSLAIYYLMKSLKISKEIKNTLLVKTNNTNLGALFARKGIYKKALSYYFEALKNIGLKKNEEIDAIINGNIGSIYLELNRFDDALKYYKLAVIINEKNKNNVSLAYNFYNLAVLYVNLNQFDESIYYFDKVISLQKVINDYSFILDCKSSKALVLNTHGRYAEAIEIFKEIEKELPNNLPNYDLTYFYFSFGSTHLDYINKLVQKNIPIPSLILDEAIEKLEKSKFYLSNQDLMKSDLEVYHDLYVAYKLKKDYPKSLLNLEFYQQNTDSLYLEESVKSLNEFEQKLELEKKDKKLLIQKNKIKLAESKQLLITMALILAVLLLISALYLYYIKHKSNILLKIKNREVNELNNTKDKLFSIIAHDLLNPIVNFKNVSELLTDNYDDFDKSEQKEYLGLMKQSSASLLEMLKNLLDWSRSQRNKIETNIEIFSINQIINDNINLIKLTANNKSITINKNFNDEFDVIGDKNLLTTVIRNLISNALKFTSENGEINITLENQNNFTILRISDNGVGIPKDKLDSLFELNTNNSTHGTNNEKGTGLGLVLSKEFMEMMKGSITIESEVGKGTIVSLKLRNQ